MRPCAREETGRNKGTKGISEEQRAEGEDEDEGMERRRREEDRGS